MMAQNLLPSGIRSHHTAGQKLLNPEEKHMVGTIGKTFGMALAGMCLVSTLAMAQSQSSSPSTMPPSREMVCTKVDAGGYCIEAKGTDDKMMTIRAEGIKVSEKMTCVTSGTDTTCTKVTVTK